MRPGSHRITVMDNLERAWYAELLRTPEVRLYSEDRTLLREGLNSDFGRVYIQLMQEQFCKDAGYSAKQAKAYISDEEKRTEVHEVLLQTLSELDEEEACATDPDCSPRTYTHTNP